MKFHKGDRIIMKCTKSLKGTVKKVYKDRAFVHWDGAIFCYWWRQQDIELLNPQLQFAFMNES